jgi:hypothetical protein
MFRDSPKGTVVLRAGSRLVTATHGQPGGRQGSDGHQVQVISIPFVPLDHP